MKAQSEEMTTRWRAEKDTVGQAAQAREALDRLRAELAAAQRRGDLQRASEIAYGEIPKLEKRLADEEKGDTAALTPEVVDAEQIAAVVSRWTGVPVDRMLEGERDKLLRMEDDLRRRVARPGGSRWSRSPTPSTPGPLARTRRSQPPHRLVPLPRPHGRRQDRADQSLGRIPVR